MKLARVILALLALGALTACDPVYGPVLRNRTSHSVGFIAAFSGKGAQVDLPPNRYDRAPNQVLWQRYPNLKLESLTVIDGTERKSFSSAEIEAAVSEAGAGGGVVIEYLGGGRIRGTQAKALRK